jgi:hypothetical protein
VSSPLRVVREPDVSVDPAALAAMGPEDFGALIIASLGKETAPEIWDVLTDPAVLPRTRKTLGSLHASVLTQLAAANDVLDEIRAEGMQIGEEGKLRYFAAKNEQAEWRRRAAHWRRMVESRMALVKSRTPRGPRQQPQPYGPGGTKNARKHTRAALETLARAIAEHERAVTSGEGDESDDEKLWDCLESVTAITGDGEELPLTEWLEYLDELREDEDS